MNSLYLPMLTREMSTEKEQAIAELILKIADDQLIIGHRHSEWIGMGPIIEEDIAFGSIANDKVGQSHVLYSHLNEQFGFQDADTLAFMRNSSEMKNSQFVELPNDEYDFSLIRHYLYDVSEILRFSSLVQSSYTPLSNIARKFRGEIKYHVLHASTWIKQLAQGTEESKLKLQSSLNFSMPYALGMFEKSPLEETLMKEGVFIGEDALRELWMQNIGEFISEIGLVLPNLSEIEQVYGGRRGFHSEYLQPLLDEMTEVYRIDPKAEW